MTTTVIAAAGTTVMDNSGGRIASLYQAQAGERDRTLDTARRCAKLTIPSYLPPIGRQSGNSLPTNFQSLGARGVSNLQGKLLSAIWPIGVPWFIYQMAPEIRYSRSVSDERKQRIDDELYIRELIVQAAIESVRGRGSRQPATLRTIKRNALGHILITGEVLEHLRDDADGFFLRAIRRDSYVTVRDAEGNVLYHVTHEVVDPLSLGGDKISRAELKIDELRKKTVDERMMILWTLIEWQPESKSWKIEQELNSKTIATREERVSPFFCTPYDLVTPDHYGTGLIEQNLGDLASYDELSRRTLDFAALASDFKLILDASTEMRASDFTKPSGSVIEGGRVQGGEVQDAAYFGLDKLADFTVVEKVIARIEDRLGSAMLLGSESVRDSERTTATEVVRVTIQELEGALGGIYSAIADEQQIPMHNRVVAVLEARGKLPQLPRETAKIEPTTGIGALSREASAQRLLRMFQIIQSLPQELGSVLVRRIDDGTLLRRLAIDAGVNEPGLIKTREQLEREAQEAAAFQARLAATGKAIDTAGNIVESAAQAQAA